MIKPIKKMLFLYVMLAGMAFALPGTAFAETYTYDAAGRLTGVTYDDGSTITYTYDSRGNRLQLTRTTVGPDIMVAPPTHDFGAVDVGNVSTSQTITISNTGSADLVVSAIGLTGANAAEFGVALGTCPSLTPTVSPASNCTVSVSFSPTSVGAKTAALGITSNDGDTSNVDIALSGTGQAVAAANIAVTPPSHDFGSVDVGSTSTPQIITISNTGTADLVVSSIALTGSDAAEFGVTLGTCANLTPTVSPASNCTVSVTFSPASTGAKSAALGIASNDGDTPNVDVVLSGSGQAVAIANIVVTPVSHDFGDVDVGIVASQTVTIDNTGTAALALDNIAVSDPLAAPFSLLANACANSILAAGGSCILTVEFSPTVTGIENDSFDISSDDPDTPSLTVTVSGNGIAPPANNPPSVPVLLSPAADAIDLDPASIVFEWQASDDPDQDPLSYQFFICEDPTFNGCTGVNVASAAVGFSIALLGGGGGGFLLLGLIGNHNRRRPQPLLSPKMIVLAAIILMASCGGGGGDSPPGETNLSHTVTGLKPATTYYWKVSADDGNGGITESDVRSFITQ